MMNGWEHTNLNVPNFFQCASALGVKVLIDAEQSYFQHSIEHLVLYHMMKKFNHTHPVIYNTAQAYLTVSMIHVTLLVACFIIESGLAYIYFRGCIKVFCCI